MSKGRPDRIERLLSETEELIRNGEGVKARRTLEALTKVKLARRNILPLATLSRRADLPLLGLRLLNSFVRTENRERTIPTAAERIEYAFCLVNSGGHQEALRVLEGIDAEENPQAYLAKSFALIAQWRYRETLPLLEAYCSSSRLDEYAVAVGKVNLVAALVWERRTDEAEDLITELLKLFQTRRYHLLRGKLLALRAQNRVSSKEWGLAQRFLGEAEDFLRPMGGIDWLLIQKWHAAFDIARGKREQGLTLLDQVKTQAAELSHWQTLRHCDFLKATHCQDRKLALHLYFGTPHFEFRNRLLEEYGSSIDIPQVYKLRLGKTATTSRDIGLLTLQTVERESFKLGQLPYRTLLALASDFYQPLTVTTLHYAIYPNNFFNPFASPARIHQLLKRVRARLKAIRSPLLILQQEGLYQLSASTSTSLLIPRSLEHESRTDLQLRNLRTHAGELPFGVRRAAEILGVSIPSALKLLQVACADNLVHRSGLGKATVYQFTSTQSKAA